MKLGAVVHHHLIVSDSQPENEFPRSVIIFIFISKDQSRSITDFL